MKNCTSLTYRTRGQALLELVVALPFFLLTLFGLVFVMRITVASERAQQSVRFSGLVLEHDDPYRDTSLFTLYNNLGTKVTAPKACQAPPATSVADAFLTGVDSVPFLAVTNTVNCNTGAVNNVAVISASGPAFSGAQQAYIYLRDSATVRSRLRAPLSLFPTATTSAQANFLRTADVGTLMRAFPEIGQAVTASLQAVSDTTTPVSAPSPFPTPANLPTVPPLPSPSFAPMVFPSPTPFF